MPGLRILLLYLLLGLLWAADSTAAGELRVLRRYETRDTLAPQKDLDSDAQSCLEALIWQPRSFSVECEGRDESSHRMIVSFPSPVSSGDATNDRVTMEWHRPFMQADQQGKAPAVLIVHESGRAMPVGRLFARALRAEGLHAFLIHLPYYGLRRGQGVRPESENLVTLIRQAVADVRRAHDAIAVLPEVDATRIGAQGTSLGGFVVTIAASVDNAFESVFIMLAGGDLYELINNGEQDAAKLRRELENVGYQGEALRALLWQIEPTRIAHRLDPQHTWLYSARQDQVVPHKNALALARAARLDESHHVQVAADHYTAIIHFATIVREVAEHIRDSEPVR